MANKPVIAAPVLVFLDCSKKAIDMVGNNNPYSEFVYGVQPKAIRISIEEMGWAAREILGDVRYADFLSMILDGAAAKQGIDPESEPDWTKNVRLVMFNSGKFDSADKSLRELLKKLFKKAAFFQADQQGAIQRIWTRGRPPSSGLPAGEPPTLPPGMENFIIEELDLGVRAYNALKRISVETIGDLILKTREDLLAIPNFGEKALEDVEECLARHSLVLRS